ncbi:MAG: hypothetical protein GF308_21480 [Candidatus Heimdallarchaeota archaeon]|nr:hypothetical protein [Candidatus Heimdallarchaeota archaeon]
MQKRMKIIIVIFVIIIVVPTILFNALYFGFFRNNSEVEEPFSIYITDVDPKDMGPEEWLEDFNILYEMVRDNYPYLWVKNRTHGYDWLPLKDYYLDRISAVTTNEEFLAVLFDAVQALQNLHTHILSPSQVYQYGELYSELEMHPYADVFTYEVESANAYWYTIYNNLYADRYFYALKALPLYDQGQYVLRDGVGDWVEEYGNGSVILAVNGIPIDEAVKSCYEKAYLNYDFIREKLYLPSINAVHFGPEATFTIQNTTGYSTNRTIGQTYGTYFNPWNYPGDRLYTQMWPEEKTAYLHIQSFWLDFIEEDNPFLLSFYNQINNYDHLIIDIRGNGGGSTNYMIQNIINPLANKDFLYKNYFAFRTGDYVQYFRKSANITETIATDLFDYLPPEVLTDNFDLYNTSWPISAPTDQYDFDGEISLLVDKNVYSAAETFAVFCKQTDFATVYGTYTGGDGIGMTPLYFVLPNSKLVIRMSTLMGLNVNGYANEEVRTEPDVLYESSFGNWTELIDYVKANPP